MPIPQNQITHAEVQMLGTAAAGGSNSKAIDLVFIFRRTAVVLPVVKAQVDAAFQAAIAVPIDAALNARFSQGSNTVRWVNDAQDVPVAFAHVVVGGVAGDSMATSHAAFILMRTGIRGKSFRGGKHLGPMSEADTTAGTDDIFNAAALARLATVSAAILAGFVDGGGNVWVPSILSRKLSILKTNPTTLVANDVNGIAVNKRVGYMTHRRVRSFY